MLNTPITPPRVPLIDPRTNLIDRAWYMFFLSLNNIAAATVDIEPNVAPNAESLIASYDAALQALAQEVGTQPAPVDLSVELQKQIDAAGIADQCSSLISAVAEIQKQIDALNSLPPPSQGTVTAVTGTAPVVSSGGTTPDISMAAASTSTNGYLTSTDWNTFNSKQPAGSYLTSVSVTSANGFAGASSGGTTPSLTLSTSITGLLYGNGTALAAATINAPLSYSAGTLSITQSGTASNGYLSSTDWNTFNGKQPAGTYVTSVTGTAPVVSSGGTTPAISMAAATTSVNGYLTSTDWNTFNGKQAVLVSGTNIKTVNGTSLLGSGDLGTITVPYGGTGLTSLTANYIPIGNGTGALSSTAQFQFDGTRLRIGNNAADSNGLDVIKGGGFNYIAKFKNTSSASGYGVAFEEPSGASAGYPTVIVYSSGGATTWFRIDTGGGTYFSNVTTTASAANAYIDTGASYQLKRSTSSARFKRDVEDIDATSSANVFKLRPIWYRSKANDDNQSWSWYGLLAEEVAEVEPRLVQWGYLPEDYENVVEISTVIEKDENDQDVEKEVRHTNKVVKEGATLKPDGVMYDRLSVMLLAELKKLRQEFDDYRSSHP